MGGEPGEGRRVVSRRPGSGRTRSSSGMLWSVASSLRAIERLGERRALRDREPLEGRGERQADQARACPLSPSGRTRGGGREARGPRPSADGSSPCRAASRRSGAGWPRRGGPRDRDWSRSPQGRLVEPDPARRVSRAPGAWPSRVGITAEDPLRRPRRRASSARPDRPARRVGDGPSSDTTRWR